MNILQARVSTLKIEGSRNTGVLGREQQDTMVWIDIYVCSVEARMKYDAIELNHYDSSWSKDHVTRADHCVVDVPV